MKANYRSFKIYTQRTITKRDIIAICAELKRELEQRYQGQFEMEPEQVNEGGLEMTNWPEKKHPNEYRTIRFQQNEHWPPVEGRWKDSDEPVIPAGCKLEIVAKALYGAVPWKPVEIKILKKVLSDNGFVANKKSIGIAQS